MRKTCLRLSVAFLFAALLPLGCGGDSNPPPKGSGGTTSGSGGTSKGGSGGGSTANGGSGGNAGSGGSATGGSAGSGGASSGGASGSGGSSSGGVSGGNGGTQAGGTGGAATGGTGGDNNGGAGGTSVGGAGGSTRRDGGADALGGTRGDARDVGGDDGEPANDDGGDDAVVADDTQAGTCDDKSQNNLETDTDCGGGTCPKCGGGAKCKENSDCRSGNCASGKCADPFAATGTVTQNGNRWKIDLGTVLFEVDQSAAAMIVTFSIDGTNFLVKDSASNGSVFWTAPQTDWNWPPPREMNELAYTPSSKDNILTMTSPIGPDDKLTVTKRFWGNVEKQAMTLEYTVKNGTTAAIQKAPWEVTRVYPGGLTFFPNAEEPSAMPTSANFKPVPFTTAAGAAWFKYKASEFTQDIKGGCDGLEGWAAHINCGAGLEQACPTTGGSAGKSIILIKQWADTTVAAPAEKELEIYANAGHNYVEFEQQGDYQTIPAGGTMVWTVHWLLRYLPTTVAPTSGSADLLTWVRGQLL